MANQLKRKRSDSELSFSSSTTLSSPSRSTTEFGSSATNAFCIAPVHTILLGRSAPLHINSRTQKRYRNNRPPDAEVHEHTLNLLYTAQQSMRRQASPCQGHSPQQVELNIQGSQDEVEEEAEQVNRDGQQRPHTLIAGYDGANQRSLHSFWNLAQPTGSRISSSASSLGAFAPHDKSKPGFRGHSGSAGCKDEDSVMVYTS